MDETQKSIEQQPLELLLKANKNLWQDHSVTDTTINPHLAISDVGPVFTCIGKGVWITCAHGAPGWNPTANVFPGRTVNKDGKVIQPLKALSGVCHVHPNWFRPNGASYTHPNQWNHDLLILLTKHHPEIVPFSLPQAHLGNIQQYRVVGYPASEYISSHPCMFEYKLNARYNGSCLQFQANESESGYSGGPLFITNNQNQPIIHGVLSTNMYAASIPYNYAWIKSIMDTHLNAETVAPSSDPLSTCAWLDKSNWETNANKTVGQFVFRSNGTPQLFWATTKVAQKMDSVKQIKVAYAFTQLQNQSPTIRVRMNEVVNGSLTNVVVTGAIDPVNALSGILTVPVSVKGNWTISVDSFGMIHGELVVKSIIVS